MNSSLLTFFVLRMVIPMETESIYPELVEGWTKKTILNLSKGLLRSGNQHERLLLEYALTGRRIFRLISDIEFIWPYPNLNQNFFGLISAIHSVFALRKTILRRVRWI